MKNTQITLEFAIEFLEDLSDRFGNAGCNDYTLDYDDPVVRGFSQDIKSKVFYFSANQKVEGSYIDRNRLLIDLGDGAKEICRREDINLSGIHKSFCSNSQNHELTRKTIFKYRSV